MNQPIDSIWNGIQGPTPPVSSADANIVTEPRTKPKPGPSTLPLSTIRKNMGSRPAVPAPSGRSAAPTAARTPSMATALASMPLSAIVATTTATSSGSRAANSQGASAEWASPEPGVGEQRPAEGDHADRTHQREREDGTGAEAHRTVLVVIAALPGPRPETVSQGWGARILATCGAKAGDETTTSAVGPSATISPSARITTRWASSAASSTSCVASTMRVPLARRDLEHADEPGLRRVVQPAGRLVEEQQRRPAGEHDGQREREPLSLGEIARMCGVRHAGQQLADQRPAGARLGTRVGVGGRALGGDGVRVQQVARLLRHEPDLADELARGWSGAG